ncbi:zinc finger protein 484 [Zeugodacus cucurbitae]|uniref:Zinc finger protein 287 n=1 Tax=Zeugodacus cucurbitae TaxID=28588 RepID=A0A0A1X831_ZEUCU|nr:zinc finger protein 484 [Zeugodacus cucurbitae]
MKLSDVVPRSCRVCLTRTPKLRSLYQPLDEGEEPPNEMLRLIAGITLEEADIFETLPKCICRNCELSLSLAYQFRIKVLHTHQIIEAYRKQVCSANDNEGKANQSLHTSVKVEFEDMDNEIEATEEVYLHEESINNGKEMKVEMLEMSFSDIDEINVDNEEEQQMLELNEDECKPEYLEEFYNESNIEASISETELQLQEENQHNNAESDDTKTEELYPTKNTTTTTNKSNEECDKKVNSQLCTNGDSEVKKPAKKSYYKKKIKTNDNKAHICDICGNIYAKRGRMMEHRRRHDKELRYACELCDKRFHLREKLRKHMYIHKGGKPFKCSFCSRTFFYESVRKAHEAIHSGLKPYVCDVCNKAFAYAHALGKHKLIHADVKLYHCDYCDKDFRLQHHMKQHIETKLHQNAVRALGKGVEECVQERYQGEGYEDKKITYGEDGFDGEQYVIDTTQENLHQLVDNIIN